MGPHGAPWGPMGPHSPHSSKRGSRGSLMTNSRQPQLCYALLHQERPVFVIPTPHTYTNTDTHSMSVRVCVSVIVIRLTPALASFLQAHLDFRDQRDELRRFCASALSSHFCARASPSKRVPAPQGDVLLARAAEANFEQRSEGSFCVQKCGLAARLGSPRLNVARLEDDAGMSLDHLPRACLW